LSVRASLYGDVRCRYNISAQLGSRCIWLAGVSYFPVTFARSVNELRFTSDSPSLLAFAAMSLKLSLGHTFNPDNLLCVVSGHRLP
jgi:hypothetical protein